MNITDIQVRLAERTDSRVRATVAMTLERTFVIHDVKVVEGRKGLFVAMPGRLCADGTYRDIVHPIDREARAAMSGAVMRAYHEALFASNLSMS